MARRKIKKSKPVQRVSKKPGDWLANGAAGLPEKRVEPAAAMGDSYFLPDIDQVFKGDGDKMAPIEYPNGDAPNRVEQVYKQIESGEAQVAEAYLFTGRFHKVTGAPLRESKTGKLDYRIKRVIGTDKFMEAVKAHQSRLKENTYDFVSNSDAGSLMTSDPNQYTEYTPFFGANFGRQQYFDQFVALSRAFELYNHFPIAKRIATLMSQYGLGRGFKVKINSKNPKLEKAWQDHAKKTKLYIKLRKYWSIQYFVDGELFFDKIKWTSIDAQSIWDIITNNDGPGMGDDLDHPLYYQQMFQSITQTFAGIKVPGVPGSEKTNAGVYTIRQLPASQIIHLKNNCYENEKRGRSGLYPLMGWCKQLRDLLFNQVAGENFRSTYVFDDEVDGTASQVTAHAQKYAYMPRPASIFAHNKAIKRTVLNPLTNNAARNGVAQEILCLIAAGAGVPKESLNAMTEGAGSRATALVGSEPFTKVIEDLQEDFESFMYQLAETFCEQNGFDYDQEEWEFIFPSVTKDTTGETLTNLWTAQQANWISQKRAAIMAAAEMEITRFDYDDEQSDISDEKTKGLNAAVGAVLASPTMPQMPPKPPMPPMAGGKTAAGGNNPIHGAGKVALKGQMNNA